MPMDSPSARDALDAAPPADPLAGAQEVAVEARDVGVVHGDREVLGGVSFEVKPGEQLGVLGTVGSGKSTLAALLGGLDRASAGEILLGGERLDDLPAGAAQRHVRVVPDVPFLFTRTLAENVALVDPPDEIDRERVRRVLHVSCFEPEEEGLKDGIDTVVGEKGIALSGGQKQRITLARALYAGGSTVVLDDVLSAVDHRTERAILERLAAWRREEGRGVTLVNISNRVSALENAKEILVLDEGRVVERGTPQELAAADGLYARTLALQQAMDEAEEASG